jgi:hypothetical protein
MLTLLSLLVYALDNIFDVEDVSAKIIGTIVISIVLPHLITTDIMSRKGYSKRKWFFLSFFSFLSWILVVIALCMSDKRKTQRHDETMADIASRDRLPENIAVNDSEDDPVSPAPEPDFRLKAIRKLKALGQPIDEFVIELEVEKLRSEYKLEAELDLELERARRKAEYEAPQSQINTNGWTEFGETNMTYVIVAFIETAYLSLLLMTITTIYMRFST